MAEIIVSIDGKDDPDLNDALMKLIKKKGWGWKGKYQTSGGYVMIFETQAARKKPLQGPGAKKGG